MFHLPRLKIWSRRAIRVQLGEGFFLTHFPKWIVSALTIRKLGFECGETLVIGW